MNARDPIILAAYLICIAIFLLRIKEAFNDEYNIRLDEDGLKQLLKDKTLGETKLEDIVGISFKFDKRYEYDKLKQLAISINNKASNYSIYVDWDQSTLTDLEGKARRVTRVLSGITTDIFQSQVYSTVNPKTTLKEAITAEDLLKRKKEKEASSPLNLEYEITAPLINLKPEKPSDDMKKRLDKFKKRVPGSELEFFLELALRVVGSGRALGGDRIHIPCKFILKKYPWWVGLPWNPR